MNHYTKIALFCFAFSGLILAQLPEPPRDATYLQWIGFRVSSYGQVRPYCFNDNDPYEKFELISGEQWVAGLDALNSQIKNKYGIGTGRVISWLVGEWDMDYPDINNTGIILETKKYPVSSNDHIDFSLYCDSKAVKHHESLTCFDKLNSDSDPDNNVYVILSVEPGWANMNKVLEILWEEFGSHSCVVGVGIDGEWHKYIEHGDEGWGTVSADEAFTYLTKIKSLSNKKWNYLLLKHYWADGYLPKLTDLNQRYPSFANNFPNQSKKSVLESFVFCTDFCDAGSLANLKNGMIDNFANHYSARIDNTDINCPVLLQIGYPSDWWVDPCEAPDMKEPGRLAWYYQLAPTECNWDYWNNYNPQNPLQYVGGIPQQDRYTLYLRLIYELTAYHELKLPLQPFGILWVDFSARRLFALGDPFDKPDVTLEPNPCK